MVLSDNDKNESKKEGLYEKNDENEINNDKNTSKNQVKQDDVGEGFTEGRKGQDYNFTNQKDGGSIPNTIHEDIENEKGEVKGLENEIVGGIIEKAKPPANKGPSEDLGDLDQLDKHGEDDKKIKDSKGKDNPPNDGGPGKRDLRWRLIRIGILLPIMFCVFLLIEIGIFVINISKGAKGYVELRNFVLKKPDDSSETKFSFDVKILKKKYALTSIKVSDLSIKLETTNHPDDINVLGVFEDFEIVSNKGDCTISGVIRIQEEANPNREEIILSNDTEIKALCKAQVTAVLFRIVPLSKYIEREIKKGFDSVSTSGNKTFEVQHLRAENRADGDLVGVFDIVIDHKKTRIDIFPKIIIPSVEILCIAVVNSKNTEFLSITLGVRGGKEEGCYLFDSSKAFTRIGVEIKMPLENEGHDISIISSAKDQFVGVQVRSKGFELIDRFFHRKMIRLTEGVNNFFNAVQAEDTHTKYEVCLKELKMNEGDRSLMGLASLNFDDKTSDLFRLIFDIFIRTSALDLNASFRKNGTSEFQVNGLLKKEPSKTQNPKGYDFLFNVKNIEKIIEEVIPSATDIEFIKMDVRFSAPKYKKKPISAVLTKDTVSIRVHEIEFFGWNIGKDSKGGESLSKIIEELEPDIKMTVAINSKQFEAVVRTTKEENKKWNFSFKAEKVGFEVSSGKKNHKSGFTENQEWNVKVWFSGAVETDTLSIKDIIKGTSFTFMPTITNQLLTMSDPFKYGTTLTINQGSGKEEVKDPITSQEEFSRIRVSNISCEENGNVVLLTTEMGFLFPINYPILKSINIDIGLIIQMKDIILYIRNNDMYTPIKISKLYTAKHINILFSSRKGKAKVTIDEANLRIAVEGSSIEKNEKDTGYLIYTDIPLINSLCTQMMKFNKSKNSTKRSFVNPVDDIFSPRMNTELYLDLDSQKNLRSKEGNEDSEKGVMEIKLTAEREEQKQSKEGSLDIALNNITTGVIRKSPLWGILKVCLSENNSIPPGVRFFEAMGDVSVNVEEALINVDAGLSRISHLDVKGKIHVKEDRSAMDKAAVAIYERYFMEKSEQEPFFKFEPEKKSISLPFFIEPSRRDQGEISFSEIDFSLKVHAKKMDLLIKDLFKNIYKSTCGNYKIELKTDEEIVGMLALGGLDILRVTYKKGTLELNSEKDFKKNSIADVLVAITTGFENLSSIFAGFEVPDSFIPSEEEAIKRFVEDQYYKANEDRMRTEIYDKRQFYAEVNAVSKGYTVELMCAVFNRVIFKRANGIKLEEEDKDKEEHTPVCVKLKSAKDKSICVTLDTIRPEILPIHLIEAKDKFRVDFYHENENIANIAGDTSKDSKNLNLLISTNLKNQEKLNMLGSSLLLRFQPIDDVYFNISFGELKLEFSANMKELANPPDINISLKDMHVILNLPNPTTFTYTLEKAEMILAYNDEQPYFYLKDSTLVNEHNEIKVISQKSCDCVGISEEDAYNTERRNTKKTTACILNIIDFKSKGLFFLSRGAMKIVKKGMKTVKKGVSSNLSKIKRRYTSSKGSAIRESQLECDFTGSGANLVLSIQNSSRIKVYVRDPVNSDSRFQFTISPPFGIKFPPFPPIPKLGNIDDYCSDLRVSIWKKKIGLIKSLIKKENGKYFSNTKGTIYLKTETFGVVYSIQESPEDKIDYDVLLNDPENECLIVYTIQENKAQQWSIECVISHKDSGEDNMGESIKNFNITRRKDWKRTVQGEGLLAPSGRMSNLIPIQNNNKENERNRYLFELRSQDGVPIVRTVSKDTIKLNYINTNEETSNIEISISKNPWNKKAINQYLIIFRNVKKEGWYQFSLKTGEEEWVKIKTRAYLYQR
eukprot:GHVP01031337.1.p1 GENE.GHVP01031337.1~~GHVP01031337.1.p1  ORF type:complete len:1833 (+),score=320.67 GHVP01031337.1:2-5500(+)